MKITTKGIETARGKKRTFQWMAEVGEEADMDWAIAIGSFPAEWAAGKLWQETESGEVYQGRIKTWAPSR